MSSKGIAGFNAGLARSIGNGYTPTEWATGDVITADKLNHMEDGIGGGVEVTPHFTWNQQTNVCTCDMSYQDIITPVLNEKCKGCILNIENYPATIFLDLVENNSADIGNTFLNFHCTIPSYTDGDISGFAAITVSINNSDEITIQQGAISFH